MPLMSEEADDLLADNLPDPAMIAALIPLVQGRFLFRILDNREVR